MQYILYVTYVIPVFRSTSCFHMIGANWPESKAMRMFYPIRQVPAPGAQSAVSNCFVYASCILLL